MIDEGIDLLEKRFTTVVGLNQPSKSKQNGISKKDDLSAIEVFYASTTSTIVSTLNSKSENNMTFVVDKLRTDSESISKQKQDEETLRLKREKRDYEYRANLKNYIDRTLPADEQVTQPLARYLHRNIREKATIERMRDTKHDERKLHQVYYFSYSFLIDGLYPLTEALHKKINIRKLREAHFKYIPNRDQPIQWSAGDANKTIVGTIFAPCKSSSVYEDNLQRLFLYPPFDIKETQKLNPRGVLLAYMAMFAHNHDPLIDVDFITPTTLRGLFSNVLDGTIYNGFTISSLKESFRVSDLYEGDDVKDFCDRLLSSSYYSIGLTFLNVKAWIPERFPQDRFVQNSNGFVSIKLPYNEVIHDRKDGVWIFNNKQLKTICYTSHFETLIHHLYRG